jgi:hypothetical protein
MHHNQLRNKRSISVCLLASSLLTVAAAAGADPTATTSHVYADPPASGSVDPFSADGRKRLPWFFSLGAWVPDVTVSQIAQSYGGTVSTGAEAALGYRWALPNLDLVISSRGQAFSVDVGGATGNLTNSVLEFDVLFRIGKFYLGPGIGAGTISASVQGATIGDNSSAVEAFAIGYDLTNRWFIESRGQSSDIPGLRGGALCIGYRF